MKQMITKSQQMVHITITLSPLLFNIGFRDYYSNNKYLLKTYYVSSSVLGTLENKIQILIFHMQLIVYKKRVIQQRNKYNCKGCRYKQSENTHWVAVQNLHRATWKRIRIFSFTHYPPTNCPAILWMERNTVCSTF